MSNAQPTSEQSLEDLFLPPKWSWAFHLRDWAVPGYLRVAVYRHASYASVQFLCFSVTYRGKGRG